MRRNKRGVFFTIDAFIALSIILVTILIAFPIINYKKQETKLHYDIVSSFSSLKIGEVNNTLVASLIESGRITDLNKTLLEQIGEFYVTDRDLSRQLASSLLSDLKTNANIGIWYGNTLISSVNSTSYETASNVDVARQIISGIQEGQNSTGYSAKAYLSSALQRKYFYFGGYIGDGNITAPVSYSGNITSAEMELAINTNFSVYVNEAFAGNFTKSPSETTPAKYTLPTSGFVSGNNTIKIVGNKSHISGGLIKVDYQADVEYGIGTARHYLPGIEGLINIYDSFYTPSSISSLSAFIHMNSSYLSFFTIGNKTVFNGTSTGNPPIYLTNEYLSSILDYPSLSGKTIPIRLGLENVSYILTGGNISADVLSVTDLSGSMGGSKINGAKNATRILIDTILPNQNSRVGLVGYETYAKKSDFHNLSTNNASLRNIVDNVWNAVGSTCICCGILKALNCYDAGIFYDDFEQNNTINTRPYSWQTTLGLGGRYNITSESIEGNLSARVTGAPPGGGYIVAMSHIFNPQEEPLSVEFMINHSSGNGRARINIQTQNSQDYIIIKLYSGSIRNIDTAVAGYSTGNIYKIRVSVSPGSNRYNLYVNDALAGSNLPVYAARTNIGKISFGAETAGVNYTVDNINISLPKPICEGISQENKQRSMIVMSDGAANVDCGLRPTIGSSMARRNAIDAACLAYQKYNITVYAVGFGSGADEVTLRNISECGHGQYYYGDVSELAEIYKQIAESIIQATFTEQTISTGGNFFTKLYPDSYIEINYTQPPVSAGIILNIEQQFNSNQSGSFTIPNSSQIIEANAISYSGARWTSTMDINGFREYELSKFGSNFITLGDPFVINIPLNRVNSSNNVSISVGSNPFNTTAGSMSNKIIYKLIRNASSFTQILPYTQGCVWNITLSDNSNSIIKIPADYTGEETCSYNPFSQSYNINDAFQTAVYNLIGQLDADGDKKIDIKLTDQSLQISSSEIRGIPFLWSTEVQVRAWS